MGIIRKQLIAVAGAVALASVGLLASVAPSQKTTAPHEGFVTEIETVLAMAPAQKDQARTAIDEARQSATPIRQELMNTNRDLRAAIRSDNTAQIQRLSATEGQEIGRLLAIRSSAVAKVYNTLRPDQRTKADALQQLMMKGMQQRMEHSTRVGS
jgi:hypothetical protein